MRIAIPTDDQKRIASHTGRCRGFAIYDVGDGNATAVEYRENRMTHHRQQQHGGGGCGHGPGPGAGQGHSHRNLLDALEDCEMMVAGGMGRRLVDDLERRGIRVVFTRERDVEAAVQAMARGESIVDPHGSACAGGHGHRHGQTETQ